MIIPKRKIKSSKQTPRQKRRTKGAKEAFHKAKPQIKFNETKAASTASDSEQELRFDFVPESGKKTEEAKPAADRSKTFEKVSKIKKEENKKRDFTATVERFSDIGSPDEVIKRLSTVGYECLPYLAVQIALLLNTPAERVRALILEGPSGCGKSFLAKSLAKITGAELMVISCYQGMATERLIESPSTMALAKAMAGAKDLKEEELMSLGVISQAFIKSKDHPVVLLVDELDKPDSSIDTFFLGPIQDSRIWSESQGPIDADPENILIVFTKNFNRVVDDALLRRCQPVQMTHLDSTLERKVLAPHCEPQLIANLVAFAERMRNSDGSYEFERPPAPEELLTIGHYIMHLLKWSMADFKFVGRAIWAMIAKSRHDQAVLNHMLRFHPDFMDPLVPDGRNAPMEEVHARLGRAVLDRIVEDPNVERRAEAWKAMEYD